MSKAPRTRSRLLGVGALLVGGLVALQVALAQSVGAQVLCLNSAGTFGACPTTSPRGSRTALPFVAPSGPTKHLFASGISFVPAASIAGFVIIGIGLLGVAFFALRGFRDSGRSRHPTK